MSWDWRGCVGCRISGRVSRRRRFPSVTPVRLSSGRRRPSPGGRGLESGFCRKDGMGVFQYVFMA